MKNTAVPSFRLNHYFRQARRLGLTVTFWLLINALANTAYGVALGRALTALGQHATGTFLTWLGITTAALTVYAAQRYFEPVAEMRANEQMALAIRRDLTTRLAHTNTTQFHAHPVPDYTSWLTNDLTTITEYGFENSWLALEQALNVVFAGVTLLHYHWSLFVAVLALTGLMLLVPKAFVGKMNGANAAVSQANARLTTVVTDLLNGFDQLFMLNQTRHLPAQTTAESRHLLSKRVAYAKASSQFYAVNIAVNFFCQLVILALTGWLYFQGKIPLGVFSTSQILSGTIFSSLTGLTENLAERQTAQPLLDKFAALPTADFAAGQPLTSLKTALTLEQVGFAYPGHPTTLNQLTYQFTAGGRYAIVGPSGVGKSTLLALLAGKLTPTAGTISFDGQNLANIAPTALHQQVAVVDQQPLLFNRSLRFNLTLDATDSGADLGPVLAATGLDPLVASLPEGLDTVIDYASANLSGGQRQRIALARALLAKRSVLLLDEATANLDPASVQAITKTVLTWPNVTVIMVTHHLTEALAAQLDGILTLTPQQ